VRCDGEMLLGERRRGPKIATLLIACHGIAEAKEGTSESATQASAHPIDSSSAVFSNDIRHSTSSIPYSTIEEAQYCFLFFCSSCTDTPLCKSSYLSLMLLKLTGVDHLSLKSCQHNSGIRTGWLVLGSGL
jgi:hypothetical protein